MCENKTLVRIGSVLLFAGLLARSVSAQSLRNLHRITENVSSNHMEYRRVEIAAGGT